MKNKVLFTLVVCLLAFTSVRAQSIPNFSFETWVADTNYLDLTLPSPPLLDTSYSYNPASWTTSNEITNGSTFSHKTLVTQSSTAHTGSSSIQLRSDTLDATIHNLPIVGTLHVNFVCPGFAVGGKFPLNLSAFVNLGSTFNPALLPGAGIPVTGRKATIGGYLQYTPNGGDTAYVVAVLRRGATVVAQATYKRGTTDPGFSYFEVPFIYQNCLEPDTLVYTLSSGNPYSISNVATGAQSGLHAGSTLLADSIFVSDTIPSFVVPPIVVNDSAHTLKNTAVTIQVATNDVNCFGSGINVTVSSQPHNGTAVASGDSIVYTPANGFIGYDTLYYTATAGSSAPSSPAMVVVRVYAAVGIIELGEGQTKIYPNPASNKLHISTTNSAITGVNIYDVLGKLVSTDSISSNAVIDLSSYNEGLYLVRFTGSEGKVLGSSRFSVVK